MVAYDTLSPRPTFTTNEASFPNSGGRRIEIVLEPNHHTMLASERQKSLIDQSAYSGLEQSRCIPTCCDTLLSETQRRQEPRQEQSNDAYRNNAAQRRVVVDKLFDFLGGLDGFVIRIFDDRTHDTASSYCGFKRVEERLCEVFADAVRLDASVGLHYRLKFGFQSFA
jgi:hypothetical protein